MMGWFTLVSRFRLKFKLRGPQTHALLHLLLHPLPPETKGDKHPEAEVRLDLELEALVPNPGCR